MYTAPFFKPLQTTTPAYKYQRVLTERIDSQLEGDFVTEFYVPSKEVCFNSAGDFYQSQHPFNGPNPLIPVELPMTLVNRVAYGARLAAQLDVERAALEANPEYQALFGIKKTHQPVFSPGL